jgi:hypothetical protein
MTDVKENGPLLGASGPPQNLTAACNLAISEDFVKYSGKVPTASIVDLEKAAYGLVDGTATLTLTIKKGFLVGFSTMRQVEND